MRIRKGLLILFDGFFLLRILLLVPVWTVLILGWISGSDTAQIGGWFFKETISFQQESVLWLALPLFSLIVAFIYVVNQIVDIESDRVNHKLFILPRGLISVKTAWRYAIVCALLGLTGCVLFLDSVMVVLFSLSLILGVCYNLPPISLKNHAWGGVIANFLGHGILTYLVGWYGAHFGQQLTYAFVVKGLVASLTAGFANAAVFLTTTIPDAAGDRVISKKTFCVRYGEKKTALAASVCCALALVFALQLEHNSWVMSIPAAISLIVFVSFVISTNRDLAFKTFRWPVFILSTFVVLFIPLYGVIIILTMVMSRIYYKKRFNYDYPTLKSK